MSRTDKDRPYNVQCHDKTLNTPERHNHREGECDFYTLEKWKRRYNDREHRLYGPSQLTLWFSCEKRAPGYVIDKMFPRTGQEEPQVLSLRTRLKRSNRRTVRRQGHMAARATRTKYTVEVLDDLGDALTLKQPRRPYYKTGKSYTKTKRPYLSKDEFVPRRQRPAITYEEWRASPYAYYRKHRMNVRSMHGKRSKAL